MAEPQFQKDKFGLVVDPLEWEAHISRQIYERDIEHQAWMRQTGISHTGCAVLNSVDLDMCEGTIIVPVSLSGLCVAQSVLATVEHAKSTFDSAFKAGLFRNTPYAFRPRPSGILAYVVTRDTNNVRLDDDQILTHLKGLELAWMRLHGKAKGLIHISEIGCGGGDFRQWHSGFGAKLWNHIKNNTNYQAIHLNDYRTKHWREPVH